MNMEAKIYNSEGKETNIIVLKDEVFGLSWNNDLVRQVVVTMQNNARVSIAHAKDRSEVSGGGHKPWRQKGTGRARHGSNRSPIWIGGGVTHGPLSEKKYGGKLNKKMRIKALFVVLSEKIRKGEVLFVDSLNLDEPKTKDAKKVLENLSKIKGFETLLSKKKNSAFVALDEPNKNTIRGFANFGNLYLDDVKKLNPVTALKYKILIITNPQESVKFIESKLA
ncbi:50S ribosomal protein L4 [Patescibacteria group bacterium]|nr:50S ribosomal protein L4 [Patescibacteria group bacterium]MBU1246989.1 50S ribosomal protein L4 [Patescibacteria group bacterium]MBU1519622.1 50S ribosomal protein L4 [Patescibacteria group bacterium]MBU1730098.1 50S ribosomal protein L4 [Patescibacteria group bacterium]MBU1956540.1 50S ribosomal protein L4 [Patescibacteria group bacterium]